MQKVYVQFGPDLDQYLKGSNGMKRCVFFSLVVMLFCVIGCNDAEKGENTKTLENSETRQYEVFGMDCPGCQGGLEKLVKKIPAVQGAKADWIKKQLTVSLRPESQLDDKDIYDAIERANFTAGKRIE